MLSINYFFILRDSGTHKQEKPYVRARDPCSTIQFLSVTIVQLLWCGDVVLCASALDEQRKQRSLYYLSRQVLLRTRDSHVRMKMSYNTYINGIFNANLKRLI